MIELNKVLLVGRLTRDPESRYTNNGTQIANFSVAVNRRRGKDNEEVSFIDCQAWDKTAEFVQQWFTKGKPILLEGRLHQDRWTDKQTQQQRTKLIVVCDRAGFASGKDDDAGEQPKPKGDDNWPGDKRRPADDDDLPY